MRIFIFTLILALVATLAAAQHTVNCWGKGLHPELSHVPEAIRFFAHTIDNVNPNFPAAIRAGPHACAETYCVHKTSIRYCNDSNQGRTMPLQNIMDSTIVISRECVSNHKGKKVAGGVVDHPDHWSVVVQKDDSCTAEGIQGIQNGILTTVGFQGDKKE